LTPLVSNEGNLKELINWCETNLRTYNGGGFQVINENNIHNFSNAFEK